MASNNFSTASSVEMVTYQMRLSEIQRGQNRALINDLFNGSPPMTEAEAEDNKADCNINDLSATRIDHDARRQYDQAFVSPTTLFTVTLDYGPTFKRREWAATITRELNKRILASPAYLDLRQGVFASVVLHGIGPSIWEDKQRWCPTELGIEDVLVPSNTLRSLTNLPFFAVFRSYTFDQLFRMTHGPKVDPGWNMSVVKDCLKWVDQESTRLLGSGWPEVWSQEKMTERIKQDGAFYASDTVPTIDTFDFFFYSDQNGEAGWRRRMILDAWGLPGAGGVENFGPTRRRFDFGEGQFLYNSKNRVYRNDLRQIMHFQFGDASAVAPFRYHSVRSLGFLLYAVCHIQNRLKCKFTDATFESLLQYFRVNNPADMDRLQKVDLVHLGFLPEGLQFVRPEERWKVDPSLVTKLMNVNRQTMADVSASFSQNVDQEDSKDETATLTMAKASTSAALVGSMLNRAYAYEKFRYVEIARRFCIPNSRDADVRKFRVECLKHGVPEDALNVESWSIEPNKVIGVGNKQLAVAIVNEIYGMRPVLDPTAQKEVDRLRIGVISDDYDLADRLVPDEPHVSDSVHDAELAFGTLMMGLTVTPKPGLNPIEVAETMIRLMAQKIHQIAARDGVGTPEDVQGLTLVAQYCEAFIKQLEQDKTQKAAVKELRDALKNLENMVKAFAQRQQQKDEAMAKQQQNGNGQMDPKDKAKIMATMMTAKAKMQNTRESHAQRTAQRGLQFEQAMKQDAEKHQMELQKEAIETAHNVSMNRLKSLSGSEDESAGRK